MTIRFAPPLAATTFANRVQRVRSPGGIEAWLLEDHTLPALWMSFCFEGGAACDTDGKSGTAYLLGSMLTESAGNLDSYTFQRRLDDKAIQLSFSIRRDALHGTLRTLAPNVDEAFDLLGMAVCDPAFQADDFERVHGMCAAGLRMERTQPGTVAGEAFDARAFAGHPFARPSTGQYETIHHVTLTDVAALHSRMIARNRLEIVAIGAIGAEAFAAALDRAFARLPVTSDARVAPAPFLGIGEEVLTRIEGPQSTLIFGRPAIPMDDPDFMASRVVNHCLGGGTFSSRLYAELREKRGLCYSVGSRLDISRRASRLIGHTSTRNDRLYEALDVIRAELARLAKDKISAEDVELAKSYLMGSFSLRLDTSNAIAETLLSTKVDGFEPGFIDTRNERIAAVTRDDVARAVTRMIGDGGLLMSIAGNPVKS